MNKTASSQIQKAVELLQKGDVVGMPTETVYGLAARFDQVKAVEKIFATKARPFFDPLILHVADQQQAQMLFKDWSKPLQILSDAFWPGPLTLVSEKDSIVSDLITSGLTTVAVRCPDHAMALELIRKLGVPVAAPSANRFGRTSPTTAAHVRSEFDAEVFVIDGGPCQVGIESTILQVVSESSGAPAKLEILRKGQISEQQISEVLTKEGLGFQWIHSADSRPMAPGMMKHHYMPDIPIVALPRGVYADLSSIDQEAKKLILNRLSRLPAQWEGVTLNRPQKIDSVVQFTLDHDPILAARNLYSHLRDLAKTQADVIIWFKENHYASGFAAVLERLNKAISVNISSDDLKKAKSDVR